ncbi:unnamed protein product [Litomosoides sigmodontis]|uniref:Papilin n=1 Tax=Litomosoides sigmodontis TaxID=42156 RepID=A0A3P6SFH5_LITSI|nr:unnamed protein product [Litomosoides sigmodontis]
MKKASLTQVALIILSCTIVVAVKTGVINLCKRQPFRGRCPAVKGKGPSRSQFVLRYYLRDNECVSYPFGHCADDENEPMLYRYKKDCEKACLNERNNTSSATAEAVEEESASALGNKGIGTTKHHVGTTSTVPSTMTTAASLQRTSFTAKKNKNKPHKLLTECERQRQASASGLIKSDFIPICTADGSFRTLQCRAPGRDCFCVDHNGVKIPNSESSGTTKPKCKQIIKARKLWMDECVSPPDSGPCNSAITRWYYDYKQQQCLEFRYSGCGGSENNHPTKADCEKQCKPAKSDVKCKDGLEPLKDENGRLANCAEIACPVGYLCSIVQSGSACCPNSTSSKATDTHSDATPDICQLPKDRGPCDQYELRFYYNNRLNECKYFFFGGCEGNANNFERVEECERFCRQRGAKANGSSIVVSAPQLITSGPQMRKLSKEFGTKPVEKANERSRLEEVTDNSASGGTKHNMGSSISDVAKTTDITDTTGGANSESNERNSSSSQTTDFSASSTNENKIELSQNIHQNVHKEMKDETTTSSDSSSPDFSPVQPKSTTTALRNTEKFVTSGDQSSKSSQEFSSQSVTVTGQQLSDRQEQVKISSSKMSTIRRHPNTGGEERLSDRSKLSSASPTDSSPSNTITAQLITSSTAEPLVPEATESIDDRCLQKRDRGTCTGQFIRWHWDSERNTCQVFTYSGCDGNGNNFRSREDCFAACHQPTPEVSNMDNVCNHSIHPGDCAGAFQRFAFDSTIGDCRPFTYTGCGGNGNNFGSSLECRNKCAANKPTLSTDICQHPIEVGECSGVFPRFAYDLIANECRQFTYGGCGGNGNNFGSIAECKETCVREQRNVSVQCPVVDISLCVEPCALFVNRRGCRECTCPVAHTTTYNQTKNGLAESSTSSPAMSFTSSADESRILETEQFPRSRAEKKLQLTPHPPKISQINAVTAELGEKCSQPMDAGPCENFIKRWFFDVSTGQCKSFEYGGCAGNRNHFFSKNECEIHCARFFNERTVASHNVSVSHAQHSTATWSRSADMLSELEHADITANQESTAHHFASPDAPSVTINHRNKTKANSSKNVAECDPENEGHVESVTSAEPLSVQHHNSTAMKNAVPSGRKVDILVPSSNVQQQTIAEDDNQFSMEVTKQEDVNSHQIDDKSNLNNAQNNASLMMTGIVPESETAPDQEIKVDSEMKSAYSDTSTPASFSEWEEGNLTLPQKQSEMLENIDVSQIHQQNDLSEEKSQIADFTATQNSKTSNNAQITSLPQIAESQMARKTMNSDENEPEKGMENWTANKALMNNSAFDNFLANDYEISVDRNEGRPLSNEMTSSMNSFSPQFEANNEIQTQLNKANDSSKGNKQTANISIREKADSQFAASSTQFPHKDAIAVAKDVELTQRNHDSTLRHRMRIINRGSVLEPSASSDSLSPPSASALPTSSSTLSSSTSSSLIPSDTKLSHSRTSDKNGSLNGARGVHHKHAIDEQFIAADSEEFSHGSLAMHTNTPEHTRVKFHSEKEVTLSAAALNNFDVVADSTNDNAIITDLSLTTLPRGLGMSPGRYELLDKIDTTLQHFPSRNSLMTTVTPPTPTPITVASEEPVQSATENAAAPSLASSSITSNSAFHATSTSVASMTSIGHIALSSNGTIPVKNNIMSTSSKMIIESTIAENRLERSLERSTPTQPKILSQPISSDKAWPRDVLRSIADSQALPKQYPQGELLEKKLSFGSHKPVGTFSVATFNRTVYNNANASRTPQMPTDNPTMRFSSLWKLSPNARDTTVGSVELQPKKPIGQLGKSMTESEENYFNADSSIFINASNFSNQPPTALLSSLMKSSSTKSMPAFILNSTKRTEKERGEGPVDLSSMHDFVSMPVTPQNDILQQFVSIIQSTSSEAPAASSSSSAPLNSQAHKHSRVNIVGAQSSNSLMHRELQPPPAENHNEITEHHLAAAHNLEVTTRNISYRTTVKQGEIEDPDGDGSANEEEEIDAELLHQQSVADSQVTQKTTPLAVVVHGVTSLQKLQLEADDTCVLPPDAGTCRDYVPRWFYNSQTGKCEQFSYGSCGGNSNNFLDREACEGKCSRGDLIKSQLPERCTYKKDEGYSNGYNVKWYFNLRNLRCEQMVYQGQGGNLNQFETLLECQTFCTPLGGKAPETDEIAKQIAHSLKATSTSLHPSGTAASQDEANHAQVESIAGISAKHISQSAAESHHRRVVSNDEDEKMRQISSKQLTISSQLPLPTAAPFQVPENLNTPRSGAVAVREPSLEPSLVVSAVNESNDKVVEKKIDGVKTLGIARENSDNDVVADLSNVFEDIGHTPSCPNGLKPAQHADGRPMMCLPGRNQCSDNSLCYFNGVDFFCCPNPEDPYDEHVFGGYGGEEVKRGYKNAKKTPTGGNELIVRKLRLKRHAQVFGTRASEINTAARIDSKIQRSLTTASLAANDSDANKQEDNICMLDATTGKCNEAHLRFFYDRRVGTCRLFYYSGCGGNENNFVTEDECRRRCKNEKVHVDDALPGSCPFGEPPFGDNAPVICGKDAQSFECPKGYYCRMGPPNVCCLEKSLPSLEKILVAKKNQKNIRFSPHTGYVPSEAQGKDEADNSPSSLLPTNICPDGSDALLDESTQKPLKCGLGYDGQSFCPVGYYCSIDSERNGRLCCKLGIIGVNIPPPPTAPPFFGLRPSNPGEVIPRGSLPSDYIREEHYETGISNVPQPNENHSPYVPLGITKLTSDVNRLTESSTLEKEATYSSRNLVQPYVTAGSSANPDQYNKETDSSENHTPSDMEFQDNSYGRMMLKSKDQTFQTRAFYNTANNVAFPEGETNEVQIDVGEMKDPFESLEYAQKPTSDRSICLLKPNEGRTCREDESPPRTNLQYFYSSRDKRCKLYFYRGCGGSQNRFDTKRHCELTCAVNKEMNKVSYVFLVILVNTVTTTLKLSTFLSHTLCDNARKHRPEINDSDPQVPRTYSTAKCAWSEWLKETGTMSATLGELLNLFENDEPINAQSLANVNNENGRETKKIDGKQNEEKARLTTSSAVSADRKLDFGCSKASDGSSAQKKKTDNECRVLLSNCSNPNEDEWNRTDRAIRLDGTGRSIKLQNCSDSVHRAEAVEKQKLSVQENRRLLQGKAQQITKALESSPKDALKVYDSFFGIRIRNPTLSSAAFESYCDGLKKIRLSQLKSFPKPSDKWISLAVIIEKTGCRKSSNGNEYMIWNTSDLVNSLDTNVKILVFGDCIKKFWKLQLGSVIALVTPPFASGDDKQITVKLTKCAQVLEMGFCPDFGHCKCERCIYHVQRAAQKFTANRGSFASVLTNPKPKLALQESNFPGGTVTISGRPSKVSASALSISAGRKNFKRQQIGSCLMQSKSLKECEKKTLDALIAKEASLSASQPHGKSLLIERNNESLKEFLLKQEEEKIPTLSPVLGKGLKSESVLLISPRKIKLSASENAKRKAVAIVTKRGGLEKADPNTINGRPKKGRLFFSPEHKEELKVKKSEANATANGNPENRKFLKKTFYTADEISALLEKKSSHEDELRQEDVIREERYFQSMEQKERLENYLTNIMEIKNCSVITCIKCKYTSHKQSDLCKQLLHTVKQWKATKRFFRCKQCHSRTISYERLPTTPCTQCGYNDFQRVAMKDEKRIKLAQENLLLRGEERKYVN